MRFREISGTFVVCRLSRRSPIPVWAEPSTGTLAVTWSKDELTIVCDQRRVPSEARADRDWACLEVVGQTSLAPLLDAGIESVRLPTLAADYVLVKRARLADAVAALEGAGHEVEALRDAA